MSEALHDLWEHFKQMIPQPVKDAIHDVEDFAEGFSATYMQNASMGLADPLKEEFPEERSSWYKAGRIAGDVFATVQGAGEIMVARCFFTTSLLV